MRRVLSILALWLLAAAALAQPAAAPKRILFIGNSLTASSDVPGRLATLANAMGRPVAVESVTRNGYSLEDHWNDGRAREAIRKGWDLVVLQQGTSAHEEGRRQLAE